MENNRDHIWVKRISALLEEKNITQKDLAKGANTSPATISAWLSPEVQQEPKIIGFNAAARYLNVSMDYLFGADECKNPSDNKIHRLTGLSDRAIRMLKRMRKRMSSGSTSDEKKIFICNYLIETMEQSPFFEDLYNYLFGEVAFANKNGEYTEGAERIALKSPSGKISETLVFDSIFSHAYLAMVYRDLSLMKDKADKVRESREERDFKEWENSEEGKAINEEFLEMLYGKKGRGDEE